MQCTLIIFQIFQQYELSYLKYTHEPRWHEKDLHTLWKYANETMFIAASASTCKNIEETHLDQLSYNVPQRALCIFNLSDARLFHFVNKKAPLVNELTKNIWQCL